ncbi:MAG: hypothetical protein GOP50_10435 [Candidatus Heimdallarchaeota archaeon]|nr:hypothetical protein [Candidatus Heimdallarchaeota archaeon]
MNNIKTKSIEHPAALTQEEKNKIRSYRMDNAAVLFSFVCNERITCLFRMAATLKEPINVNVLQRALDRIIGRFPYYRVNQRPGFFWFYWETNLGKPKVMADSKYTSQEMPMRKKGIFPFRVRAFQNRIAVEFYHALTDGTGAITFLKALVAEYLTQKGIKTDDWGEVYHFGQQPHDEEYEDAFKRFYNPMYPKPKLLEVAFQIPHKLEKTGIFHMTTGIIDIKEILAKSKELNVTLTEFLSAVYIDSLQKIFYDLPEKMQKKLAKPIRIMIPVNLRRFFPTKTMRNFSLFVTPGIDPRLGHFSFDEILETVHHYMRVEVNDRYISQQISRNVRGELHPLMRGTPLFIKRVGGIVLYSRMGEKLYSGTITNLGRVVLPEAFSNEVESFEFLPAPSPSNKASCAMVSFKDKLYLNFGRVIADPIVERNFFRKLKKLGISVKIETN